MDIMALALSKSSQNTGIESVSYDGTTGTWTFAKSNGQTQNVSIPLDNFVDHGEVVGTNLVLTMKNGETLTIPASALIDEYTGEESETAYVNINQVTNKINVAVKDYVSKTYVDNQLATKSGVYHTHGEYLPKTGGVVTGTTNFKTPMGTYVGVVSDDETGEVGITLKKGNKKIRLKYQGDKFSLDSNVFNGTTVNPYNVLEILEDGAQITPGNFNDDLYNVGSFMVNDSNYTTYTPIGNSDLRWKMVKILTIHGILSETITDTSYNISWAHLKSLIDANILKRNSGQLEFLTFSQLYERTLFPVCENIGQRLIKYDSIDGNQHEYIYTNNGWKETTR